MRALVDEGSRTGNERSPRSSISVQVRKAIDPAVAAVFGVDISDLCAATRRSPRAAFARQVAMYLAHVVCGLSLTEVGALFGRDRTTVAHACEVVEDRRDDPDLDARLDHLECAVAAVVAALSWCRRRP
jgi:chromosomal replication initiation ATPase DnaA